ncbi:MAG: hypothetical protein H6765_03140 [Candidatus Peribacteria bacterium]|nr:MAG: hypothetical protein H6765_03140 [Candidatus Peribacteria bacterium]
MVKRRDLLTTQGKLFIQHTAYLETGLLDQLNSLKRDLNGLNQVEYSSFQ